MIFVVLNGCDIIFPQPIKLNDFLLEVRRQSKSMIDLVKFYNLFEQSLMFNATDNGTSKT